MVAACVCAQRQGLLQVACVVACCSVCACAQAGLVEG